MIAEREDKYGAAHPSVAEALTVRGRALLATGDRAGARAALARALAIREKTWKRPHPAIADSLLAIAALEEAEGRGAQARAAKQRATKIQASL